jgi:hypothetical protein
MYKTVILPVVLHGCETWFLTLREEHRFRVSENRVLRRIFRPMREEVARGWRRLHNEKFCDLYPSTKYEGSLKSSWTHLITPSRNFVKVR